MVQVPTIRETELKRRRSRIPWIYIVYHARSRGRAAPEATAAPGPGATTPPSASGFLPPSEEGGNVERRGYGLELGPRADVLDRHG